MTDETEYNYDKKRAAKFLKVAVSTLTRWMSRGIGPHCKKLGGTLVRFRLKDLQDFIEASPGANSRRSRKRNNHHFIAAFLIHCGGLADMLNTFY